MRQGMMVTLFFGIAGLLGLASAEAGQLVFNNTTGHTVRICAEGYPRRPFLAPAGGSAYIYPNGTLTWVDIVLRDDTCQYPLRRIQVGVVTVSGPDVTYTYAVPAPAPVEVRRTLPQGNCGPIEILCPFKYGAPYGARACRGWSLPGVWVGGWPHQSSCQLAYTREEIARFCVGWDVDTGGECGTQPFWSNSCDGAVPILDRDGQVISTSPCQGNNPYCDYTSNQFGWCSPVR